ncbi:hypothetical protein PR048_009210 [Dryococelus australis]|uniref:Uncharacterized protein n=1 Tax=Dryococelus australis TaxID=614101 RepID=A0ABQ9HZ92_9NEOP|nr:hypothetical protein PR048_009210 [Dryococelus australis]
MVEKEYGEGWSVDLPNKMLTSEQYTCSREVIRHCHWLSDTFKYLRNCTYLLATLFPSLGRHCCVRSWSCIDNGFEVPPQVIIVQYIVIRGARRPADRSCIVYPPVRDTIPTDHINRCTSERFKSGQVSHTLTTEIRNEPRDKFDVLYCAMSLCKICKSEEKESSDVLECSAEVIGCICEDDAVFWLSSHFLLPLSRRLAGEADDFREFARILGPSAQRGILRKFLGDVQQPYKYKPQLDCRQSFAEAIWLNEVDKVECGEGHTTAEDCETMANEVFVKCEWTRGHPRWLMGWSDSGPWTLCIDLEYPIPVKPIWPSLLCPREASLPNLPDGYKSEFLWLRRNRRAGETGDARENSPTSDIVPHDSNIQRIGSDPTGNRTRFALGWSHSSAMRCDALRGAVANQDEANSVAARRRQLRCAKFLRCDCRRQPATEKKKKKKNKNKYSSSQPNASHYCGSSLSIEKGEQQLSSRRVRKRRASEDELHVCCRVARRP